MIVDFAAILYSPTQLSLAVTATMEDFHLWFVWFFWSQKMSGNKILQMVFWNINAIFVALLKKRISFEQRII